MGRTLRSRFFSLLGILPLVGWMLVTISVRAYPAGPEPAKTGGFGELTCRQSGCHVSYELDAGKTSGLGDLLISGLPTQYEPGKIYPVKLAVTHTQDRRYWGFQLAARMKETGAQAGELKPTDDSTQVLDEKGITYIEHTLKGIAANTFTFSWVAPTTSGGEIVIHAAGNAADGDDTPEGDYIYSTSVTVAPPTR